MLLFGRIASMRCSLLLPMFRGLCVSLCFCLFVTIVSCAKTAEPIKMPFEIWPRLGPENHELDGEPVSRENWAILRGISRPIKI